MSKIDSVKKNIEAGKKLVKDIESLEKIRLQFLGKKGDITNLMKGLSELSPEERKSLAEGRTNSSSHARSRDQ